MKEPLQEAKEGQLRNENSSQLPSLKVRYMVTSHLCIMKTTMIQKAKATCVLIYLFYFILQYNQLFFLFTVFEP